MVLTQMIRATLELEPTANRHFKLGLAEMTQAKHKDETPKGRRVHLKGAKAAFTQAIEMDQAHGGAQQRLAEVKRMLRSGKKGRKE